jgi:hypothetical protein
LAGGSIGRTVPASSTITSTMAACNPSDAPNAWPNGLRAAYPIVGEGPSQPTDTT